jgi:hypothetical protein
MLETNFIPNSPSSVIAQDAQGIAQNREFQQDQPLFVPDPDRIVETLCVVKTYDILSVIFNAFKGLHNKVLLNVFPLKIFYVLIL